MARTVPTPFGRGLRLARVAGVEVCVHWSVGIVLALLSLLLAQEQLPASHHGSATALYWVVGAGTSLLFLASLVGHELAHAAAARHAGLRVERMTLWLLGGLTELGSEAPSARDEALIAGAGPATSLGLGMAFGALSFGVGTGTLAGAGLAWLGVMNVVLAVFNLLPAAPLDGGRLLSAVVWWRTGDRARATRVAATAGTAAGWVLIFLGFFAWLSGDVGGLWVALVGWFISSSARGEQAARDAAGLSGLLVRDVMELAPVVAPSWWTLGRLVAALGEAPVRQSAVPIVDVDGRAAGGVTLNDLERAVRRGDYQRRIDELRPGARLPLVPASAPLTDALAALRPPPHLAVVVNELHHPVGLLEERTIVRSVQARRITTPEPKLLGQPRPAA